VHFGCANVRGSKSASIVEGLLRKGTSLVQTFVPVGVLDSWDDPPPYVFITRVVYP